MPKAIHPPKPKQCRKKTKTGNVLNTPKADRKKDTLIKKNVRPVAMKSFFSTGVQNRSPLSSSEKITLSSHLGGLSISNRSLTMMKHLI